MNINCTTTFITKGVLENIIAEIPIFISAVPPGRESFFRSTAVPNVTVAVNKSFPYGNDVETIAVNLTSNLASGGSFYTLSNNSKVITHIHSRSVPSISDHSVKKYSELMDNLRTSWAMAFIKTEVYNLETFSGDFIEGLDDDMKIGFEKHKNNQGYVITLNRDDELLYFSETKMPYGNVNAIFNQDVTNLQIAMVLAAKVEIGGYLLPQHQNPGMFDRLLV